MLPSPWDRTRIQVIARRSAAALRTDAPSVARSTPILGRYMAIYGVITLQTVSMIRRAINFLSLSQIPFNRYPI